MHEVGAHYTIMYNYILQRPFDFSIAPTDSSVFSQLEAEQMLRGSEWEHGLRKMSCLLDPPVIGRREITCTSIT